MGVHAKSVVIVESVGTDKKAPQDIVLTEAFVVAVEAAFNGVDPTKAVAAVMAKLGGERHGMPEVRAIHVEHALGHLADKGRIELLVLPVSVD